MARGDGRDAYKAYVEAKRAREAARAVAELVEAGPLPEAKPPRRRGFRRLAWTVRLPLMGFGLYYFVAALGCARWAADNGWSPVWSGLLGPLFLVAVAWLPALVVLGVLLLVGDALDDRARRG